MARNKSEKVVPTIWLGNPGDRKIRIPSLGLDIGPRKIVPVTDFRRKYHILMEPTVNRLFSLNRLFISMNEAAMDGP